MTTFDNNSKNKQIQHIFFHSMNNTNKENKYLFKKIFSFNILKKGLCVLFCFLNSIAYLQETDSLYPQKYYYNSGRISSEGKLENGLPVGMWRNYYESGNLRSEGEKQAGKSSGTWIFYLPNGIKEKQITYRKNLKNGSFQQFDSTGKIALESWYENDTLQGISKTYKNGKLKTESNFSDGKKSGIEKVYDEADGRVVETVYYNAGEVESSLRINQLNDKKQKSGLWRTFYPDGKLKSECYYENDEPVNECKNWTEKGILMQKQGSSEFREIVDIRQTFHPNGKLATQESYSGKLKHGTFNEYDSTGILLISRLYNLDTLLADGFILPNGNYDSSWVYFYPDGQKASEGKYKNGVKTGLWKYYNPNGKLVQKGIFRKGVIDGEWNWYFGNGQLRRTESYISGRREGLSVEFDSLGKKVTECMYVNDLQDGAWFYDVNGLMEKGTFSMGLKTGLWKHYYQEETLIFTGTFKDGVPVGKHYFYYNNGTTKKFGKYKKGLKQGDWKEFDEKGNLIHNYYYQRGKLIAIDGDRNVISVENMP